TTPGGALGAAPATILAAPGVAVTYANLFPAGVPGLAVIASRFLPAARWYLLPAADRSPLDLVLDSALGVINKGVSASDAMEFTIQLFAASIERAVVRIDAAGSPLWSIRGG
ncbi:hypothetical protein, partial [Methylibium sp.]|uniref:hypothetical protein n=1 Tax=Methylibium sp. TaxID=2067992 RepID=UPI0017D662C2